MARLELAMKLLVVFAAVVLLALVRNVSAQMKFADVSRSKGLKGREFISTPRPFNNRYFGATIFDANQDGFYDLLLPNHGDAAEFYFGGRNGFKYQRTETFRRDVHSTAACDWDNDGDEEFIAIRGGRAASRPNKIFTFEVNSTVKKIRQISPAMPAITERVRGRSSVFVDVNGDGKRDLILVNRHKDGLSKAHMIYENRGNGKFRKHTSVGFEETIAAWFCMTDIDRNGYLDMLLMGFGFVEVWMGTGKFRFKKENWRFPGGNTLGGVRGCVEVDLDSDGVPEIYLVRGREEGDPLDDVLLKVNYGKLREITRRWNVPKGGHHSHVTALDGNNDGRMDVYVTVVTWLKGPRKRDILLKNMGTKFIPVRLSNTGLHKPYVRKEDGDNATAFDYNNDGKVDLLLGCRWSPWRLYENRTPSNGNKWLRIAVGRPRPGLQFPAWFKDPWGALVQLTCEGKVFTQRTGMNGMSHSASNLLRLTFGVGKCVQVNRIRVYYIGGVTVRRWAGRGMNREIQIGAQNCPGRRCIRNTTPCKPRCATNLCEVTDYRGSTLHCPVKE